MAQSFAAQLEAVATTGTVYADRATEEDSALNVAQEAARLAREKDLAATEATAARELAQAALLQAATDLYNALATPKQAARRCP